MDTENKLFEEIKKHLPQLQIEQLQEQLLKIPKLELEVNNLEADLESHALVNAQLTDKLKLASDDLFRSQKKLNDLSEKLKSANADIEKLLPFKHKYDFECVKHELECEKDKVAFMNNTLSKVFDSPVYEQRIINTEANDMLMPNNYGGVDTHKANNYHTMLVQKFKTHTHSNSGGAFPTMPPNP